MARFTLFFQWLISGETLTAGSASTLLPGFVVYANSVSISFSQFYHSLDISGCDAPADILIINFRANKASAKHCNLLLDLL